LSTAHESATVKAMSLTPEHPPVGDPVPPPEAPATAPGAESPAVPVSADAPPSDGPTVTTVQPASDERHGIWEILPEGLALDELPPIQREGARGPAVRASAGADTPMAPVDDGTGIEGTTAEMLRLYREGFALLTENWAAIPLILAMIGLSRLFSELMTRLSVVLVGGWLTSFVSWNPDDVEGSAVRSVLRWAVAPNPSVAGAAGLVGAVAVGVVMTLLINGLLRVGVATALARTKPVGPQPGFAARLLECGPLWVQAVFVELTLWAIFLLLAVGMVAVPFVAALRLAELEQPVRALILVAVAAGGAGAALFSYAVASFCTTLGVYTAATLDVSLATGIHRGLALLHRAPRLGIRLFTWGYLAVLLGGMPIAALGGALHARLDAAGTMPIWKGIDVGAALELATDLWLNGALLTLAVFAAVWMSASGVAYLRRVAVASASEGRALTTPSART
jgi:hypothetical protein